MTTKFTTKEKALENRQWRVVDATDVPLGRLASQVANVLRGKDKPSYTPHADDGDFVVVINAAKVKLTGSKLDKKLYIHHTGHIGSLKTKTAREMLSTYPERVIQKAVYGMIPKGPLGRQIYSKLKVYAGAEHPHQAQQPEALSVKSASSNKAA